MTEQEHSAQVERGRQAAATLEGDLFDALEAKFVAEWKNTPDREEQFAAWALVQALTAMQSELRRIVAEGEHSREVLRRAQSR